MKSFKQLLMEATSKVEEYVFHQNSHFPLSSKMIERIQGVANKPMYAAHVTDSGGAEGIVNIQNTAKQISVMTDPGDALRSLSSSGVATRGGVFLVLRGIPVLASEADFWTKLDIQGRRWISLSKLYYQIDRTNTPDMHRRAIKHVMLDAHRLKYEIIEDVIDKFVGSSVDKDDGVENLRLNYEEPIEKGYKSIKWGGSENDFQYGVVQGDMTPFHKHIWTLIPVGIPIIPGTLGRRYGPIPIPKQVKGYMIRKWYDGVERIMQQSGLDMIEDMLNDVGEDYSSWDEISMNQFEVVMLGITNDLFATQVQDLGDKHNIPVDHIYFADEGTVGVSDFGVNPGTESRLRVYYAQIQQQTPNAIRLLVDSRTEEPTQSIGPTGRTAHLIEYVAAGRVSNDSDLTDIMFGFAGGSYKVPYWEVAGNYSDFATYVDVPKLPATFKSGDLVNPLMYNELDIQAGDYMNIHLSNGYNPDSEHLIDALYVFADLCQGRYSTEPDPTEFIWYKNTGMAYNRTASGVAVGIMFSRFGITNGWEIANKAALKMREHYSDFPVIPQHILDQNR